jgi:hypothetical protein
VLEAEAAVEIPVVLLMVAVAVAVGLMYPVYSRLLILDQLFP